MSENLILLNVALKDDQTFDLEKMLILEEVSDMLLEIEDIKEEILEIANSNELKLNIDSINLDEVKVVVDE